MVFKNLLLDNLKTWNPKAIHLLVVGYQLDDEPILYIGTGWKSPFPSNKKLLFGVPGMKVLCLCVALWVRKCQAFHLEVARKAWLCLVVVARRLDINLVEYEWTKFNSHSNP